MGQYFLVKEAMLMLIRLLCIGVLFILSNTVGATERLMVNFELKQDSNIQEQGYVLVSNNLKTWNKGLQKSYLKLKCKQLGSGKTEKLLSTVDLFDGLKVSHQRLGDSIEFTVVLSKVQPRYIEIHKLAVDECKDLSPIVTTTVETYRFMAKKGLNESHPFGSLMTFRNSVN
tara:strand:+ start:188 stop:703 length:516 start_codon:yes stop_codon:yes gene_type:complete